MNWPIRIGLAALVALVVLSAYTEGRQRREFIAACEEDRKPYECVAMWRAGSPPPTTTVVVPGGRY